MSRGKKMTITFLIVALVAVVVVTAVWWRVFFGVANPPLTQTQVVVQSSTASAPASSAPVVAGENPPLTEESLAIDGATFNVEIASTAIEQARGLSFRPALSAQSGMLFLFGTGSVQTFWMKDMNFPLDMIWISGNAVAGFAQDVPAPAPGTALWGLPIYSSPANVDKVLEVSAGTVVKYHIKVGDTVSIASLP
jgi:uncharacterized membrane protein (UPF0127 family)